LFDSRFKTLQQNRYVDIIGYDTYDKINHAYAFGGVAMTINTIQAYLDIPIDFFVTLNMQGLEQIVDSIGGITLTPTATFTQDSYSFYQGEIINLDGKASLAYSRNRHADDSGDYGRQARQREIIMAIIEKGTKVTTLATKIPSLIKSLQGNMTTNLSVDDMWTIINKYSTALGNIEQVQLKGEGQLLDDGIYYEMINEESLEEVQNILQKQLDYHLNID
ncbi:TPA: LCP family protein, partial [Enterococcus faecium]|nr:transcriptional regulator [Enterococcus faecalis]HAP7104906.1 transcriptional regulator [Enterococcus faecium]HAP5286358.1 transcriptional regulator [Enterococcus faecalis]HAP5331107.1 transcriptional regulator [Enterococcus faecalis]HAP5424559.1 transcriptional regulator [Enterococcus faecalis]